MYCTGAGGSNPPSWNNSLNKTIIVKSATGIENNAIPFSYSLSQNYPNPFNPTTKIKFDILKNSFISLKVYNIAGQEITSLVNETLNAGSYEKSFDASKLSSGICFYKIIANDFVQIKKMSFVK